MTVDARGSASGAGPATAFSPRVRHALTCTAEREPGASAYHRVQLPYASALKRDGNIVCVKQ